MDLESFLRVGIDVLRLIPLILIFYIPALLGVAILSEKGEDHQKKAGIMIALGFGVILGVHLLLRTASVEQILSTIVISVMQMAIALLLALFTVYKLAD